MTVGTWTDPDFENQKGDGTVYVTNLDNALAVAKRLAAAFAAHESDPPDMKVQLDAGYLPTSGALPTEIAAQETATLVAPAANPRHDIVYVDKTTGAVGVAEGAEDPDPDDPAIPTGKVAIARVRLETTTTELTNLDLNDLRGTSALGPTLDDANIFLKRQSFAPPVMVASASELVIPATANTIVVTDANEINSITGYPAGTEFTLIAAGGWQVNFDGDNIKSRQASSYGVAVNQALRFVAHDDDKCTLVAADILIPTKDTVEAAVNNTLALTAGRVGFHPGVVKFWCYFDGEDSGPITPIGDFNVVDITDNGAGLYTVNVDTDFSGTDWAAFVSTNVAHARLTGTPTAGGVQVNTENASNTDTDAPHVTVMGLGDQ